MTKPLKTLLDGMSEERKDRIQKMTEQLVNEVDLYELRKAKELTQQQLASELNQSQAAISKLENQSDMYISTLRRFLSALGADLKIIAQFPDKAFEIKQFKEMEKNSFPIIT